jgi:hypothetical protein
MEAVTMMATRMAYCEGLSLCFIKEKGFHGYVVM